MGGSGDNLMGLRVETRSGAHRRVAPAAGVDGARVH